MIRSASVEGRLSDGRMRSPCHSGGPGEQQQREPKAHPGLARILDRCSSRMEVTDSRDSSPCPLPKERESVSHSSEGSNTADFVTALDVRMPFHR